MTAFGIFVCLFLLLCLWGCLAPATPSGTHLSAGITWLKPCTFAAYCAYCCCSQEGFLLRLSFRGCITHFMLTAGLTTPLSRGLQPVSRFCDVSEGLHLRQINNAGCKWPLLELLAPVSIERAGLQ